MDGDVRPGKDALIEGISPEWWARAILGDYVAGKNPVRIYHSGSVDLRVLDGSFLVFDLEPRDGVRVLALGTQTLVGAIIRRLGDGTNVTVSRWVVRLSEVLRIRSAWTSWVDPRDPNGTDLSPQAGLTAQIELRSPLESFGAEIHLPLDRNDYGGDPTLAVRRFVTQLEEQLSDIGFAGPGG